MKSLSSIVVLLATTVLIRTSKADNSVIVQVTHDLDAARPSETIVVPWSEIISRLPDAQPDHLVVRDAKETSLPSQFTNFHPDDKKGQYDEFLFQHDFAQGEKTASFTIEKTTAPVPPFPSKVFARYVPERLDDFAWENDRIAHRIYGPGLDTPAAGKSRMISSGIDVWCKSVRHLVVDRWYLRGHDAYHKDNGEGLDMFDVGTTRGCGGTGLWDGKQLHVSHNWKSWRILANGPIRAVFELTYEPWDSGGFTVSETKRFTVDAGHNLDQVESTFTRQEGTADLTVAIGLAKPVKATATPASNTQEGWMSLWEQYPHDGNLGVGVVVSPELVSGFTEDQNNHLALIKASSGQPVRYHAGAGWDRSGDFSSQESWNRYLSEFAGRLRSPIKVVILSSSKGKE